MYTELFDFRGNVVLKCFGGFDSINESGFVAAFFSLIKKWILHCSIRLRKNVASCKLQIISFLKGKRKAIQTEFAPKKKLNKMKPFFSLLVILFCLVLFLGCSKTADTIETKDELVARLLTGGGNKVWRLTGLYLNDIAQILTDTQTKFTKTYRADPTNADPANPKTGTFTNSDGYIGTWKLINGAAQLYEKFTNNPVGPVAVPYIINSISDSKLDIEYTQNFKSVREVYNGF